MTSARKIAANRNNAAKSAGPRTTSGKKRSSRNATKHGLSAAHVWAADTRVTDLADRLAGETASAERREHALAAAQAYYQRERAARAKIVAIEEHVAAAMKSGKNKTLRDASRRSQVQGMVNSLPELKNLDRYEGRAFATCNRALKHLHECE